MVMIIRIVTILIYFVGKRKNFSIVMHQEPGDALKETDFFKEFMKWKYEKKQ
jgi:hypothetical protein